MLHNIFPKSNCFIGLLVAFLLMGNFNSFAQINNEEELKKQADKDFKNEDYNLAYKSYSQLVSLYPKDAEYNFRLGVCMIYTEPDKKKPYSYLKIAMANPKDAPKDAKFYLAKTYHINYKFDEAIKLYTEYKLTASASSIKKLQVDREIETCKNGKRLLSNLSDLVIVSKKQLNEADYFRSYDLKDLGGKLLVKPDDFKSNIDKKKKEKSVIYLPRNGERIYYSSYGENENNGRDIYFSIKLPSGEWSKTQSMPATVNTEYDEDYPFLHPNGNTLYFSSKGHNSMGGYDIFKTTYSEDSQTWSNPENLAFPINSPDDDILFVTDSLEKQAWFSTGRYSSYGKIDVLKINTERRPMDFAYIKGSVVKEDLTQSVKSKLTVKNISNGEIIGSSQAQDNGEYTIEIPNGGKFIFTVETPGISSQSETVEIPTSYSLKPYKQIISYENKKLKVTNFFNEQNSEENYLVMLDLIEKKAKLEVNESEPYSNNAKNANLENETSNLSSVNTTIPTVKQDNEDQKNDSVKNVTNEDLLSIAKTDAQEASVEAQRLKKEANEAFGLATQKTAEAVELEKNAETAFNSANSITDVNQKNIELEKASDLKAEAKIATDVANTAMNMAKKLEVDANVKQKETDLTTQYIKELEAITKNKNNKEALSKLESIQKELDALPKQKNQSDELFESLKAEALLKQNELTASENKSNFIINEIANLKSEKESLDTDLANELDKTIKENIRGQITDIVTEIDLKNNELEVNNKKNETLTQQVEGVNKEIEIAAKILNDNATIASNIDNSEGAITTQPKVENNVSVVKTTSMVTETNLKDNTSTDKNTEIEKNIEVKNKLTFQENKTNLEKFQKTFSNQSNESITKANNLAMEAVVDFNKAEQLRSQANTIISEKEKLLVLDSANTKEAQALSKQLMSLELFFNENPSSQVSSAPNTNVNKINSEGVNQSSKEIVTNTNTLSTTTNEPTVITNNLKTNLNNVNETKLSTFNSYKNPESIALKEQAVLEINEALNEDKIIATQLENITQLSQKNNSNELINQSSIGTIQAEAEKLNDEAFKIRQASINKSDAEKEIELKKATQLEKQAFDKKMDAANRQQQFNAAKFEANQQSLEELKQLAKTKNISELEIADMQMNEANLFLNKAKKIRQEANYYPNDATKLGGYGNAEEKENLALEKQEVLLNTFKKYFPDYVVKQPNVVFDSPEFVNKLNETESKSKSNTQKHIDALTKLYQANEKEYKSTIATLPPRIIQIALKIEAESLYKKSQPLIEQSNSTYDIFKKKNYLIDANTNMQNAITLLNQIDVNSVSVISKPKKTEPKEVNTVIASNTTTTTAINTVSKNDKKVATQNNLVVSESNNPLPQKNSIELKIDGIEINNKNNYSDALPIPIDEKIQDGLIFKVQIGAFKQPLPNSTFKGLKPIIAQSTSTGYLRYMAGNFEKFENANSVKNELRKNGYSDAFVVAYFNGQRISINEAIEKAKAAGQNVVVNNYVPITQTNTVSNTIVNQPVGSDVNNQPIEVTKELEKTNGLLFTIQIGLFSREATRSELVNLKPIYSEKLPNGSYRYTAGIYNQVANLLEDKQKVIDLGIKDAFVSAYYNSKRIPFSEGKKLQEENKNLQMEKENPIIFSKETINNTQTNTISKNVDTTNVAVVNTSTVEAFTNGVINTPSPTIDNGIKTNEVGLSYKVQIGIFKYQVPNDVAALYLNIKNWPVNNYVSDGLYIYTIGNFSDISFAKKLKEEAVLIGINDAFITVYKDGKKLSGSEAAVYLK